jgi:hypothetical protein
LGGSVADRCKRVEGKQFRLAQEIKYIQRRAAQYDARFVTVGPLVFFSTQTGDAWMLDPSEQLAARLARDGDPELIDFQEPTPTSQSAGKVTTTLKVAHSCTQTERPAGSSRSLATPLRKLLNWAKQKISKMFTFLTARRATIIYASQNHLWRPDGRLTVADLDFAIALLSLLAAVQIPTTPLLRRWATTEA